MASSMSDASPSTPQSPGAFCAVHPERRAHTFCNRCGTYACELCFQVAADRQDYCTNCLPLVSPRLAERGTRLAAVMLDQLAVFGPFFLSSIVGAVLGQGDEPPLGITAAGVLGSLAVVVYQLYLLVTVGQSLGKRLLGIKVVRTDGSPVELSRLIFLRNVVPGLLNLPTCNVFGLVDVLVIFGAPRRCLHDYIADTQVIVVNKPAA